MAGRCVREAGRYREGIRREELRGRRKACGGYHASLSKPISNHLCLALREWGSVRQVLPYVLDRTILRMFAEDPFLHSFGFRASIDESGRQTRCRAYMAGLVVSADRRDQRFDWPRDVIK